MNFMQTFVFESVNLSFCSIEDSLGIQNITMNPLYVQLSAHILYQYINDYDCVVRN